MLKRIIAAIVSIALAQSGLQASASEIPVFGQFDYSKALIVEQWEAPREQQSLGFRQITAGSKSGFNYFCKDLQADGCLDAIADKNQWLRLQVILPPCENDADVNCINALSVYKQGKDATPAKFLRSVYGNSWSAIASRNIPEGGTTSLWSQPDVPNQSGSGSYSVMVKLDLGQSSDGKAHISGFEAQVMPYRQIQGSFVPHSCLQAPYAANGNIDNVSCGGIPSNCAWTETGACGEMVGFAPDSRVKLSLRLSNSIGGWFSGRIKDPTIDVKILNSTQNAVVLDAMPVEIPMFKAGTDTTRASDRIKAIFNNCPEYKAYGKCWTAMDSRSLRSVEIVDAYREVVNDSASYVRSAWLIRAENAQSGNRCLDTRNRVLGIVATNAMIYQSGIPKFSSGSLEYWVAGMHYLPDGKSLALGSYDLVMRSDVARCLYGFSSAPVQASVAISGEGSTNIATTVTSEANGWLKLAAYGFTFSTKTIGIKLVGKKVPAKSITCVKKSKPSETKKVSGINPKCPSGFVKR